MIRSSRLVALLAGCLALAATPGAAQIVSGRVTDRETGEPILGAEVALVDADGAPRARATTNRAGSWSLRAPLAGSLYRVRVERVGYARIDTEPFTAGAEPVTLQLATRREVVMLEGVSATALAYAGVLERAERRTSARTLLPGDVARRIDRVGAKNTSRLVAHLVAGLEMSWTGWPHFPRVLDRKASGFRYISCDAVVAVDGIPHFKDRPESKLEGLVPLPRVRAVEVFNDPIFLPGELRLDSRRSRLDPEINCGVVAIWTDAGLGVP